MGFLNKVQAASWNVKDLVDVQVDGIDRRDHPDYVDAFISYAVNKKTGKELTDAELDDLNENHSDFVHEQVMESLY